MALQKVNPKMITLARESRGLTQSDLANELGVTQGKLSKIEQDLLPVSDETLAELSSFLNYPKNFFHKPDTVCGHAINLHRKRSALPQKTLRKIDAHLNIRKLHLHTLLDDIEITGNGVPECPVAEHGSPEEVALHIRKLWKVPDGPVENMTNLLEKAGCIVVHCDFESQMIDGVSVRNKDLPPVIFVNKDIPGDRLRFTLAHELGHLVMHTVPSPDAENEADKFASELLMPAKQIMLNFAGSRVDLMKLAGLKPVWKVSMAALLVRAGKLGFLTDRQSQYLWMQFSKAGYRTKEPAQLDIPQERPRLLNEIVKVHLEEISKTHDVLAELLGINESEFAQMYIEQQGETKKKRKVTI